jgi:hypothetical protein
MWNFSHVREIARSDHHCVVEETARTGASLLFGALGLLTIAVSRSVEAGSIYYSVRSSFITDRLHWVLVVRRRIITWSIERVYESLSCVNPTPAFARASLPPT